MQLGTQAPLSVLGDVHFGSETPSWAANTRGAHTLSGSGQVSRGKLGAPSGKNARGTHSPNEGPALTPTTAGQQLSNTRFGSLGP
jgi:hypothetical protein